MDAERLHRTAAWVVAVTIGWALLSAVLPAGLPLGIVALGLVLGSLSALTAMGLVLVHRSSRIVNFAQAEIGGLAAAVAVVMVVGEGLPYFLALPVGLAAAVLTGALVDVVVVRRFFTAPRLILTVATIGLAQLLAGIEIQLPHLFADIRPLATFKTPFKASFEVSPVVFTGDHVMAVVVVPVVLIALGWFLQRSGVGVAIRGAADSSERALLLGIPVRRLSTITWVVAAALSGIAAMLTAPILGPSLGALAGPEILLAPLAAAVLARMESLPVALGASLLIGVAQQAVFWSYPRSSAVDLGLFLLVLVALLVQRRPSMRGDDGGLGGYVAVRQARPVPQVLARLPEVRRVRGAALGLLVLAALAVPAALPEARVILFSYVAIYGIVAISLVVLTGWAGQISLGQFAFVGLGAAATGTLVANARVDLFVSLLVSAVVGALAAALVGLPALRIRGLLLAVTTLAFSVPVSTYFLNSAHFPRFTPHDVRRPAVLGRFDLDSPLTFYYFCLVALVLALVLASNFRRSRVGRTVVAVRDNERAAASFSVAPFRAKLTAFAFSGALAGLAGGLYVLAVRGIGFAGFAPVMSLQVFTMVVVGGLGSLSGALLGAAYVQGAHAYLRGGAQLLATGTGLLVLLMVVPGGLGEVAYRLRDRLLRVVARRHGLEVPSLTGWAAPPEPPPASANGSAVPVGESLLRCEHVDAGYGGAQILSEVGLSVTDGEMLAVLGTNGAGKSTLLRVVAGILPPSGGRVVFDGRDVTDLGPAERVAAGLVLVPGGRGVFGSLTVAENLRLAGWTARRDPAFVARATERALALFPRLAERLGERAQSLSGGEQQMLTLAQALLCRPRLLMIDELSLGLAPTVVATLLDVLRELRSEGMTIVVVEQSANVASAVVERAVFMEKGRVRFDGRLADLFARPDLLRAVLLGRVVVAGEPRRAPRGSRRRKRDLEGPPALEAAGLGVRFGGVTALDGVDLTVAAGSVLGVIGSNGAGKTTLLDVWSGHLRPDEGRVFLAGRDVTTLAPADRALLGLGRSFQDARLFPSVTVAEALAIAMERHVEVKEPVACTLRVASTVDSERVVARRVAELLEAVGLEGYRDAFVSELSTGTRRVLDLACTLAHRPSVLLLDEPSSGIAQRETEALGRLLLDVKEQTGATLVVIEHDIPLVSSIADELVCMHLGGVIARGTPAEVLADPQVVASYLGSDESVIARSGRTKRGRPLQRIDATNR